MEFNSRLTEHDFIKSSFRLLYGKPWMKFLVVIAILMLIGVGASTFVPSLGKVGAFQVIFPLFVIVVLPAITYWSSKKSFTGNNRLSEKIEYRFLPDRLEMSGESFQTSMTWDKIPKVTKTRHWLFVWQDAHTAHPIPQRDMEVVDFGKLKPLLDARGVKNNL